MLNEQVEARLLPFMEHLVHRDRRAAVAEALALLDAAVPAEVVVESLLVRAQTEVGRLWECNEWRVADEHAATSTNEAVLAAVSLAVDVPPTRGRVVVCCVEGEWHRLPSQFAAELLRLRGFDVVFLGASTPAEGLEAFLREVRPIALGVSCTLPLNLANVRPAIAEARSAGVPVLAGGRAFGADDRRARRLGADAWANSAAAAESILDHWVASGDPEPPPAAEPAAEWVHMTEGRQLIAARAYANLAARFPPLAHYDDRQQRRTREDLNYILGFLATAVLVDDARLFVDFARWLREVLVARGVPLGAVAAGFDAVADALGPSFSTARAILDRERATA